MQCISNAMELIERPRMKIKDYIKSYKDFPIAGVDFKDISSLCNSDGLKLACDTIEKKLVFNVCNSKPKILALDARGFIFGSIIADRNNLNLILCRKKGKLPGETIAKDLQLEYNKSTLEIQKDTIKTNDEIIIIDDLMATGGTVLATIEMVKELGGNIAAVACIIDLPYLGGSNKIKELNIPFYSSVKYD